MSGERVPHYIKANRKVEQPRHIMAWDTESYIRVQEDGSTELPWRLGAWTYQRRASEGQWVAMKSHITGSLQGYLESIEAQIPAKSCLYAFAHNAGHDLQVTDLLHWFVGRGWHPTSLLVFEKPLCIRLRREGRTLCVLDTLNFWEESLERMGARMGFEKWGMPSPEEPDDVWGKYCLRDCEVLMQKVVTWLQFLRTHDLGNFSISRASQAYTAWRHRFMSHRVLVHCDEGVLALERAAYYGGRVEAFRIGVQPEEQYWCLDVNAMYPALMAEGEYPTRLIERGGRATATALLRASEGATVCARVVLYTDEPCYPYRGEGRLLFPTGYFRTALCGAELVHALQRGRVLGVEQFAVYERAPLFTGFVNTLYSLRREAASAGDEESVLNLKLMMNSLYGRFGMRGRHWQDVGVCEEGDVGATWITNVLTQERYCLRGVAGRLLRLEERQEPRESVPILAAAITADARMLLWKYIIRCPPGGRFYCDTDSLIVNAEGYAALHAEIDPHRLGALKIERQHTYLEVRGAKDYTHGSYTKRKGVRAKAVNIAPNAWRQERWRGYGAWLSGDRTPGAHIAQLEKHLSGVYHKGVVQPDGTVLPHHYPTLDPP